MDVESIFSVPIFFIVLRETIEAAVIVSVLLAFLKSVRRTTEASETSSDGGKSSGSSNLSSATVVRQPAQQTQLLANAANIDGANSAAQKQAAHTNTPKPTPADLLSDLPIDPARLSRLVWIGTASGLGVSFLIGAVFLFFWYTYSTDLWSHAEKLWEGIFSIVASVMVAVTALAMLKGSRLYAKYQRKLAAKLAEIHAVDGGIHGATSPAIVVVGANTDVISATDVCSKPAGSSAPLKRNLSKSNDTLSTERSASTGIGMINSSYSDLVKLDESDAVPADVASDEHRRHASMPSTATGITSTSANNILPVTVDATDDANYMTDTDTRSFMSMDSRLASIKKFNLAFFWLPFITVLREGLEGVVFIGGVSLGAPPTSIPLAAVSGVAVGSCLGLAIHYFGSHLTLHWFFVVSSGILLLLADGLLARAVGNFEDHAWSMATGLKADDIGSGAFDPRRVVWHLDCCSPEDKTSGWGIFNALLGWRNNATISTITIYCTFWMLIIGVLFTMRYREHLRKTHQPTSLARQELRV